MRPVSGHKMPGCAGTWIAIGTYGDPDLKLCAECRGTARFRDPDDAGPPTLPPIRYLDDGPEDGSTAGRLQEMDEAGRSNRGWAVALAEALEAAAARLRRRAR